MAIITKPTIEKNEVAQFELDKLELSLVESVLNDSYFQNPTNWSKIKISYSSTIHQHKETVIFDATQPSNIALGSFLVSDKADNDFLVRKITIEDFDGGYHEIFRNELNEEEFDIFINQIFSAVGLIDVDFRINAIGYQKFNGAIRSIYHQSNGDIFIGGGFTNQGGVSGRQFFIKVNLEGVVDDNFCTNSTDGFKFNSLVRSIQGQADGKILVAGTFIDYGTAGRNYLVRLNSDGTLDTAFCANAVDGGKFDATIYSVTVQSDGKILVGGQFLNYGGVSGRSFLVRLNSDGTLDTDFCVNAVDGLRFTNAINGIESQLDGKILLSGFFVYKSTLNKADISFFVRLM